MPSSITYSHFEDLPAERPLVEFSQDGDCFVSLDGVYVTKVENRGVRGQARLWARRTAKQFRWRAGRAAEGLFVSLLALLFRSRR